MTQQFLAAAYSRRPAPKRYDPSFLNVELARIARSMPSYVIRSVTAATTVQINDGMIVANANSGAFTITLPDPAKGSGQPVTIKKSDASANAVLISGTVDSTVNPTLTTQNDSIVLQSDGTTWFRPMITASGTGTYASSVLTVGSLIVNTATVATSNLLTNGKDFSVAAWVKTNATVAANDTTAPDGTLTADKITTTATSGNVYEEITGSSASAVTIAVSVKYSANTTNDFGLYDATAASWLLRIAVNWVAGVATSLTIPAGSGTNLSITSQGSGWYLVSGTTAGAWVAGHTLRYYLYPGWLGEAGFPSVKYFWDARAYQAVSAIEATGPVSIIGTVTMSDTLAVTGTATFTAKPIMSSLTASRAVFSDSVKGLVSNAVTGTGNVVMSASPTLTGTAIFDGITLAADKSIKVNIGRYSAGFPWSYFRLGSTSSGLRISNAADVADVLELANTGYLTLLIAQATPSALAATQHYTFASTVSGATLMGYGTTGDVTLKSRSGSDALYVVANSVNVRAKGSLTSDAATGGVGYAAGAGGTVTQGAGSGKATAFTLSKVCGQITTDAANLGVDTTVSATWTNTAIAATDVVQINHVSGGTIGAYDFNVQCGAGTATLNITNRSTGALAESLVLSFVVIKGVTA